MLCKCLQFYDGVFCILSLPASCEAPSDSSDNRIFRISELHFEKAETGANNRDFQIKHTCTLEVDCDTRLEILEYT